jgi:hypothetical protein
METNPAEVKEMIYLGTILAAVLFGSLILSYVTVALRLWVRCRITRSASWDDGAIVATLVSLIDGHHEDHFVDFKLT